jgi:hypothetical protein
MGDALLPHEREAAEAHAAGCDRCLAVLAATAQTTPEGSESAWWQSLLRARWLVPVTAAAAALTLWVAVDRRTVSDAPRPEATVAERLTAPPSQPAAPPSEPAQPAPDMERKAAPQAAATPEQQEVELKAPARFEDRRREADAVAPATEAPAKRGRADGPTPQGSAVKEERDRVAKDAREPQASPEMSVARRPAAAPAPPAAAAETVVVTQSREAAQSRDLVQRFAAPTLEVRAPDPQVRWRVAADTIQRSVDGGLSWQAQISTTGVSLLAGSAPSSTACWFAGRGGAVFVTADGVTWRRVTSPASEDLTAIAAEDGRAATATTAAGAVYRTSDGGATWVLQETPAASF